MPTEFEKKVADFIKSQRMFGSADRILLAVSGGADSMALLYVMAAMKAEGILRADLICAHINHQLRGSQADGDEDFVVSQAEHLSLLVITRRIDVRGFARKNKLSIETAARQLRLENLLDIAKADSCGAVAAAHHKDDNAETIVQRLSRGTGFRGLGGIRPVRDLADGIKLVRPLLCVTRKEIIEYLEERNLKWRTDHTNADCRYRRNFIRHHLIPEIQKQCSGSIAERLFELSQSARRFYQLICDRAEKVWVKIAGCSGGKVVLDLKMFSEQHPAVKVELVRRSLSSLGCGEQGLTQGHYEKILQLAERKTNGKKIKLPNGFAAYCDYGKLIFEKSSVSNEILQAEVSVNIPGRTEFAGCLIEAMVCDARKCDIEKFRAEKTKFIEWFDLDKVKLPLIVRFRKAGDRFWPLGLAGEKKVGKFITAEKVPCELRRRVFVVADAEKIIWLYPVRMCEQVKVTGKTRKILQLEIMKS